MALTDHEPATIVEAVVDAKGRHADSGAAPTGIGISLGGMTDGSNVAWAPFLKRDAVPLGALVDATGLSTRVENDIIALAEADRWFGVGRGLEGFAVITIGDGVGYGVVAGGEVVRTPDAGIGLAGTFIALAANLRLYSDVVLAGRHTAVRRGRVDGAGHRGRRS